MGWLTHFIARRGAIPDTANWVCVQYTEFKIIQSELNDRDLLEQIIKFRYSIPPLDPEKKLSLEVRIPLIQDLTDLAFEVLKVETDDGTLTSPFKNDEWVAEVRKTMSKVVRKQGLQNVEFEHDD